MTEIEEKIAAKQTVKKEKEDLRREMENQLAPFKELRKSLEKSVSTLISSYDSIQVK